MHARLRACVREWVRACKRTHRVSTRAPVCTSHKKRHTAIVEMAIGDSALMFWVGLKVKSNSKELRALLEIQALILF